MKIALVTDAWQPQVNGVVTTLVELVSELAKLGHMVEVIQPGQFRTRPCPGYPGIDLAIAPKALLRAKLDAFQPDAIHLATEGPLGWAGRSYCLKRKLAFTTAFHTKFPEIVNAAVGVPVSWGYALFRHFHRPSSGVMVPTQSVLRMLDRRGFRNLRSWTHGVDTALFNFQPVPQPYAPMGLLPRDELAKVYAAADLFVFPSHADTFGLVMAEAMAAGTPVAAYPVDGPLEVLGRRNAEGRSLGGAMHADLQQACYAALAVPRHEARARALDFSWSHATEIFASHLVPARAAATRASLPTLPVTQLSSGPPTLS